MAIRNEEVYIKASLDALLCQTYPRERMEILISDGESTDGTGNILAEMAQKDQRIRIFKNSGKIVSTGLNRAIRESRGDILVRVDGHTRVAPDYVEKCVHELLQSGAANAGGRMRSAGEGLWGEAIVAATESRFGIGNAAFHYCEERRWVDTVYMGAWKRETFRSAGLFDEELVRDQDDELNYRIRHQGGKILLSPEIRSVYTVRSGPGALLSQYFQYGFWKVRVLQKHPAQMQPRQFVPAFFVLALCGSAAAVLSPAGRAFFLAVLTVYLAADMLASGLIASTKGWRYFPRLLVVFAVLHTGYGAGFLAGLVWFAPRWLQKVPPVPVLDTGERIS